MSHPFESIPPARRGRVVWPLAAVTLGLMAVMIAIGRPLENASAPAGIVSFELAGTMATASAILRSWNSLARAYAAFGLGLDYLYMVAYSTAIGFACVWAGMTLARRNWPLAGLGNWLGWGLWLAALCDATENAALLVLLLGGGSDPWPALAWGCATVKFLLVGAGLLYAAYGGIAALRQAGASRPASIV